jgi:hypothetical protein
LPLTYGRARVTFQAVRSAHDTQPKLKEEIP